MKLNKMMMMGIVMALLLTPTAVFADELNTDEQSKEERQEIRLEQVAEYTPENYDEWARLFGSADVLKADRETLKVELEVLIETVWKPYIETLKGDVKVLVQAYSETLKTQVEAGEITREEAKVLFEAYKVEAKVELEIMRAENQEEKAAREIEKAYYETLRAEKRTLNESIKLAVESETTDGVAEMLNAILIINQELENHAGEVNSQIDAKIEELKNL